MSEEPKSERSVQLQDGTIVEVSGPATEKQLTAFVDEITKRAIAEDGPDNRDEEDE